MRWEIGLARRLRCIIQHETITVGSILERARAVGGHLVNDSVSGQTLDVSAATPFQGSRHRWFFRGAAVGMLSMAAVNAVSYFFRSADWSGLIGRPESLKASLGFPWVIWEEGNTYRGMFVDYPNLFWNILFASVVGAAIGTWAARRSDDLNRLIRQMPTQGVDREHHPIQFSLRSLMIGTVVAALVATFARHYAARAETLIAIYTLGPFTLVVIAMLPQRLSWQKRVAIIIPATFTLIAVAIVVGITLGMEFDKVMMGVFLCWTPQSVLGAVGLSAWVLVGQLRTQ